MIKQFLLFLAIVTSLSSASFAQQSINGSIIHDGIPRTYSLYVPASYNPSTPTPLIFCFHGYTSTALLISAYSDFEEIADTAGYLVVFPQGTLLNGNTHWNVGGWTTGSTVDDVGFTEALLDELVANYSINEDRVYAAGMSNGGYMSMLIGCQLSDRFAAIASVTGAMNDTMIMNCNAQRPMPVMQIHGTSDTIVPYNGNPLWTTGISDVLDHWAVHNNCDATPVITNVPDIDPNDGSTVEHYLYSNGDDCAVVEHYKVIGGEHDWPGSWGNMDIHAASEIWRFFSEYDIHGKIGCGTMGIAEPSEGLETPVYPNPTKDELHVDTKNWSSPKYKIFNTAGIVVHRGVLKHSNASIDVSMLKPGLYYLNANRRMTKFRVH